MKTPSLFLGIIALFLLQTAAAQTTQSKPKTKTTHPVKKKKQFIKPAVMKIDSSEEAPPPMEEDISSNTGAHVAKETDIRYTVKKDSSDIMTEPEQMPEFPGGQTVLMQFIAKNTKYPQSAIDKNVMGTVYIRFVVNEDGSISNCEVLRGIGGGCDEEALRVVKAMPAWKPGTMKGKPVKVQYNIPFRFKLSDR